MIAFIIRRLGHSLLTLFIVSVISFVIINLPPGSYIDVQIMELEQRGDVAAELHVRQLTQRYGLDLPMYIQYLKWITGFFRGDFGESFEYTREVSSLIGERLVLTLAISIATLLFQWLMAIPIGIYSATHQYSPGDYGFTVLGFIGLAMPDFLLALTFMVIAIFIFHTPVGGLFSQQYVDAPWNLAKVADMLKHIWIPVIVVGMSGTAELIRMMRANLLDVLGQQFVQTARVKGLKERVVVYKHAVRVAINPLISTAGMWLPRIISGATIASIVLSLPTTGPLYYRALLAQDMYLAGSFLMFLTVLLVLGNFLADLALAWADPRIRYERGST